MALIEKLGDGRELRDHESMAVCIHDAVADVIEDLGIVDRTGNQSEFPDLDTCKTIDALYTGSGGVLELFGMIIMRCGGTPQALEAMYTMLKETSPPTICDIYIHLFKREVYTDGSYYWIAAKGEDVFPKKGESDAA